MVVLKLIASAKRSLILIDNWATPEVLDLFAKKRESPSCGELADADRLVPDHELEMVFEFGGKIVKN